MKSTVTPEMATSQLKIWKDLSSDKRDKIVFEALFSPNIGESIPMFSDNIKDSVATERLIAALKNYGVPKILVEEAPRSTLSIVKFNGISLPLMPRHKAIAYIAYLVVVSGDAAAGS